MARLKQPYFLRPADGDVLSLAGLYERWRDPATAWDDPDGWLTTFTIITTTASDDVGHVHDRMPMTIEPDRWDEWLDPTRSDPDALVPLMAPPAAGSLQIYPVTPAVTNVRSNGPQLIQPIQVSADPIDPAGPR